MTLLSLNSLHIGLVKPNTRVLPHISDTYLNSETDLNNKSFKRKQCFCLPRDLVSRSYGLYSLEVCDIFITHADIDPFN